MQLTAELLGQRNEDPLVRTAYQVLGSMRDCSRCLPANMRVDVGIQNSKEWKGQHFNSDSDSDPLSRTRRRGVRPKQRGRVLERTRGSGPETTGGGFVLHDHCANQATRSTCRYCGPVVLSLVLEVLNVPFISQ